MTHNVVHQITSNNVVKKNTSRNVGYAYLVGTIIYFLLGFLGSLGILGRVPPNNRIPENIMQIFETTAIIPFLIEIIYVI